MAAGYLAITLERNSTWQKTWTIADNDGVPIDITGWTFEMEVKASAGAPGAALANANITVTDAPGGELEIVLEGADFAAVAGTQDTVVLAYDLRAIKTGGVPETLVKGPINLEPGVTT